MKLNIASFAAASAFALAASTTALAQEDIITLGASVQQTGGQANTYRYYSDSYKFATDVINTKGGGASSQILSRG